MDLEDAGCLDQAQVVVADDEPDPGQTTFAQVTHGAGDCRFAANQVAAALPPVKEGTGKCHLPFNLDE
ncbi:hypothetical protein ABZ371_00575 [Streptomyces sp. NPDC005899]|uniref:hypothetical protein n=1 Tax=Streptomyces sp. NPDC005899 TaxID=3155716 RepID=UPI0033ECCEEC